MKKLFYIGAAITFLLSTCNKRDHTPEPDGGGS